MSDFCSLHGLLVPKAQEHAQNPLKTVPTVTTPEGGGRSSWEMEVVLARSSSAETARARLPALLLP